MAGIYIHIPYCKQACHYCDFHFSTNLTTKAALINSICKEVLLSKSYLDNQVIQTIYFGGGTPSLLSIEELSLIMQTLQNHFQISSNAEITLEANPDDLQKINFENFLNNKINRLSIGIQSLNDGFLKYLNRAHTAHEAYNSVINARKAGFSNISVDLIYGIPHSSHELWKEDLEKILTLEIQHLSSYCLTIEQNTVFGKWSRSGKLDIAEDEFAAAQFEMLQEELGKKGFEQYEISNSCKPGYISKHNSNYWKGEHYLGLGPGAHSFNGLERRFNVSNNNTYITSINIGKMPYTTEVLAQNDKANEYLLTSIRTAWGCDVGLLIEKYGVNENSLMITISRLEKQNLVTFNQKTLKLTPQGMLLADFITSELFV